MAGHTVRVQRDISAEPADVWAVISDVDRFPAVLTNVDSVERLAGAGYAPGVKWRETRRMFGRLESQDMSVAEANEPARTVVAAESKGTSYETTIELSPSAMGTSLSMTFCAETSHASAGQKFAWAVMGPIGARATKSVLAQDLADIAVAVESTHRR